MKKLFTMIAVALFFISTTSIYAQTPTGTPDPKTATVHTKKDGTPDKRYKENKVATKSTTTKKTATTDTTKKAKKVRSVKKTTPATN